MINVHKINTEDKAQVERFVKLPFRLYKNHPQWVPPILIDSRLYLNRKKHHFLEHSDAEFFIAERDGRDVGRITAMVNNHFNEYHGTKKGQFYFFDCENDPEISEALFTHAFDWLRERGMTQVIGPKGFGPLDGYGLLVEGFEHRQMMTMMNYNYAYYPELVEKIGFHKDVDFVSCYAHAPDF